MLPEWLSIKPASTSSYNNIKERVKELKLHTVCTEAHCPNITECWSAGTATFMVLGGLCTRGCRFCAVKKSAKGQPVDPEEPMKLAQLISEWKLDYVVVTSVCRDDLPDQGAEHFASCVREVKKMNPTTKVELLIPDFSYDVECLRKIADSHPDVVGHNLESVERLNPEIRDRRAGYKQSLMVLNEIKKLDPSIYTKSALMLGMGETEEELQKAFEDLRSVGVDFLAMGQYLRPSDAHAEVKEYVTPQRFKQLKDKALEKGFMYVASGPFVRSSYMAGEAFTKALLQTKSAQHAPFGASITRTELLSPV